MMHSASAASGCFFFRSSATALPYSPWQKKIGDISVRQSDIRQIAREILEHYGFSDWDVVLDDTSLRLSARRAQVRVTTRGTKELGLTLRYWARKPHCRGWRDELLNSVLHEVAHLQIEKWDGETIGHNWKWRHKYINLLRRHFPEKNVRHFVAFCNEIPMDWARRFCSRTLQPSSGCWTPPRSRCC